MGIRRFRPTIIVIADGEKKKAHRVCLRLLTKIRKEKGPAFQDGFLDMRCLQNAENFFGETMWPIVFCCSDIIYDEIGTTVTSRFFTLACATFPVYVYCLRFPPTIILFNFLLPPRSLFDSRLRAVYSLHM